MDILFKVTRWQHVSASTTRPSSGHLVTLNKISVILVVFWLVILYSLFVYIEHNGDESPKDQEYFQADAGVHSVHTRNKSHPHRPVTYLSCFQKNTHCSGVRILNILPGRLTRMKMLSLKLR